jgi:5-methylcytosine-specific restriction endonuclease McrA
MATCKICLKSFKNLRFESKRICICGRCTTDLNNYKQVAESAYGEARQMLERGIVRRAQLDSSSANAVWIRDKATRILSDPKHEVDAALPGWINRLVADTSNRSKIFKMIRAHRRKLLHLDRPYRWGYPSNWQEVAKGIKILDKLTCVGCRATGVELHVHHIVYASNFGTHQRANLITLCRPCHEREHRRVLDFGENMANTDLLPST